MTWFQNAGNLTSEDINFKHFPGVGATQSPYRKQPSVVRISNPLL